MTDIYTPPKVWTWDKDNGGKFASTNRPIAGATHEKELPRGTHPFQLHSLATPNGVKVTVMFEELLAAGHADAEYDAWLINIGDGDQFGSGFVDINPNSKIPALIDYSGDTPVRVFESGAILMHLAEKHGKFLPLSGKARIDTLVWTFWQVGGLGPMIGQWGHFSRAEEKILYAIERYLAESIRLLEVMEDRLEARAFLAGDDYTIADMMGFPWVKGGYQFITKASPDRLPPLTATRAWVETIDARPAVQAALKRLNPEG